jgi:uncharacterized protein (DUF2141 family)
MAVRRKVLTRTRLLQLLLASATITAFPPQFQAASLSGTVHYSGNKGSVSQSQPIKLFLFNNSKLKEEHGQGLVASTMVTTNPADFEFTNVPAGVYYLAYGLSLTPTTGESSDISVGDPYQFYNQQYTLPVAPLTIPQSGLSGLSLEFGDHALLSGIAGTIRYDGILGQVSPTQTLIVVFFTDSNLTQESGAEQVTTNGGRYDHITLDNGTYYAAAFFDLNGNDQLDPGEPLEVFHGKSNAPGDAVVASPNQVGANFEFGGEAPTATTVIPPSATPTPTPTSTPTPPATPTLGPCTGDCGHSRVVTLQDLVLGVSISLGDAPLTACPSFDQNLDEKVTVPELAQSVGAALFGCQSP